MLAVIAEVQAATALEVPALAMTIAAVVADSLIVITSCLRCIVASIFVVILAFGGTRRCGHRRRRRRQRRCRRRDRFCRF